jgi:hypothetical protein
MTGRRHPSRQGAEQIMVSLSFVLEVLSAGSGVAVILGIPFIYAQMRQNARMVEAANRQTELVAQQNRSQVLLSLAERMTDRDFVLRRKVIRDIITKHSQEGWEGFINSMDGFEIRAFATQYESAGLMVKLGLIEEEALMEALGLLTVIDWISLTPAIREFEKSWGRGAYPNFQRLAQHAEAYWKERGATFPTPGDMEGFRNPAPS